MGIPVYSELRSVPSFTLRVFPCKSRSEVTPHVATATTNITPVQVSQNRNCSPGERHPKRISKPLKPRKPSLR